MSYKNDDGEVTLAKVHFRVPETVKQSLALKVLIFFSYIE